MQGGIIIVDLKQYLKQLETLVNIDSGSYNPYGLNKIADYFEHLYKELGWHVCRHDLGKETGNLLVITNRPAEYYDVMLIGHMDTVFPEGTVAQRPFSFDGTKAYGPGCSDLKGSCLAMYHVAKHLDPEISEKLNICIIYNPDEEIGSRYSKNIVGEIGRRTGIVFVMEAISLGGEHCFSRKGIVNYELEFHGIAAHAGFIFEKENASAILELGYYTVELMQLIDEEAGTSVNVGNVEGGFAANVVPPYARMSVEMRFTKESERERIENKMEEMLSKQFVKGVRVKVVNKRIVPPFLRTDAAEKYIARARQVAKKIGMPFLDKDRGGISDANHLSQHGCICLDGMGVSGGSDHTEHEFTLIESLEPCVKLLCALLEDLSIQESNYNFEVAREKMLVV